MHAEFWSFHCNFPNILTALQTTRTQAEEVEKLQTNSVLSALT